MTTASFRDLLIIWSVTPIRYFLFDLFPDRKRPLQFDKAIPLTIVMHYWILVYPIPGGKVLARVIGVTLAGGRIIYNGYGLLLYDTYHLFIKNKMIHSKTTSSDKSIEERKSVVNDVSNSNLVNQRKNEILQAEKNWEETYDKTVIDDWNFPVRRYLYTNDQYFKIQEVGAKLIDKPVYKNNK
ncbi:hypothetical protein FP435_00190 (plasmid) [Lactobacillus sp. PV037]|uniref:hypothetical protein n=1 Tax=Lactobacillus sp. PV037 TaxID=2594496 RepID=UPI00223F669F|nr:hypothetical protein [Lactobacillus sp. PV037]QNQ82957.1 hypothetical protein FP435_00190 [Lactobacillus sp. PV037]